MYADATSTMSPSRLRKSVPAIVLLSANDSAVWRLVIVTDNKAAGS